MVLQIPSSSKALTVTWEALPADFVLPDDPVENINWFPGSSLGNHIPRLCIAGKKVQVDALMRRFHMGSRSTSS